VAGRIPAIRKTAAMDAAATICCSPGLLLWLGRQQTNRGQRRHHSRQDAGNSKNAATTPLQ